MSKLWKDYLIYTPPPKHFQRIKYYRAYHVCRLVLFKYFAFISFHDNLFLKNDETTDTIAHKKNLKPSCCDFFILPWNNLKRWNNVLPDMKYTLQ